MLLPLFRTFNGNRSTNVEFCWSSKDMVASTGSSNVAYICDRDGTPIDEVQAETKVISLQWSNDGEYLMILVPKHVIVWSVETHEVETIDFAVELCYACWAPESLQLFILTCKGAGHIYDWENRSSKSVLDASKRRVAFAKWSSPNHICIVTTDKVLTTVDSRSLVVDQIRFKAQPTQLEFVTGKDENFSVIVLDNKTIVLCSLKHQISQAHEFVFQHSHGRIVSIQKIKNSRFLVGFNAGIIVEIDVFNPDKELSSINVNINKLSSFEYCRGVDLMVVSSSHVLNIFSPSGKNLPTEYDVAEEGTSIVQSHWNSDGSILSLANSNGFLRHFECTKAHGLVKRKSEKGMKGILMKLTRPRSVMSSVIFFLLSLNLIMIFLHYGVGGINLNDVWSLVKGDGITV
eukprot:TRINITY_DN24573_c0_g1_i1.p1 TRINITY_DN24573_c0_g1~~TRINITY_DN24573_c0_g1_i1.p1  ORF type:complete len:403 (-),score=52.42 TRINITY_DN24573_c0_g1_i1:173-1381(-)